VPIAGVEQTAIALYLADKFPAARLGPTVGDPGRGAFLTMPAYYSGVIEPAFTSKFMKVAVLRGTAGWVDSDEVMDFVNTRLDAQPYIAGETFTAGAFALFMASPMLVLALSAVPPPRFNPRFIPLGFRRGQTGAWVWGLHFLQRIGGSASNPFVSTFEGDVEGPHCGGPDIGTPAKRIGGEPPNVFV